MSYSYDPNYFAGFNAGKSLRPAKAATVLGTSWSGKNAYSNGYSLTQQQNLTVNRNYKLYQYTQRNPGAVLTNNVTTLPQGNGSQFLGYGYIQTTGNNSNNIYV